jgi:hypothetical protein
MGDVGVTCCWSFVSIGTWLCTKCMYILLWSIIAGHSLSLAQTGGMLFVSHGMPIVGRFVVLSLVWCIRTEEVRGDVDHGDGLR